MSRPGRPNGLRLPRQLRQELSLDLDIPIGGRRRNSGSNGVGGRKDRRKAERAEKRGGRIANARPNGKSRESVTAEGDDESDSEQEQFGTRNPKTSRAPTSTTTRSAQVPAQKLKSILKRRVASPNYSHPLVEDLEKQRSTSPGLVLDKSSKSFRDRAAQDEVDIATLEKKLGLKTKKLPKSFDEDGLGDLLEGLDSEDESKKRKREGQDWLERKRRKAEAGNEVHIDGQMGTNNDMSDSESGTDDTEYDQSDLESDDLLEEGSEFSNEEKESFDGFASDNSETDIVPAVRKRENPYVAPVSSRPAAASKYIPPLQRKKPDSETESLHRLRRQVQGQLNKLSEAKLLSILSEVEKLYQTNVRQDVISTIVDLVLSLFCDPSALQNTFVILHAAFVAAIYKVIGTDFGAEFLLHLVDRFESFHKPSEIQGGKQSVNLISVLAHLYTFYMVGSNIVFDHLRKLLEVLTEANAERILRIVRDAGPQLRREDPSSLKDVVLRMQNAAANAQAEGVVISVRTKFMIETITDLKNNKLKPELASSGVAIEHITRMRKVLGSLNSRSIRASEPLRIGLSDIHNADKCGKWWLVGASWTEQTMSHHLAVGDNNSTSERNGDLVAGDEEDLGSLARQHRMNTEVRRALFVAIMSADDYHDAHTRILKLRLKKSQEHEIPRVLMHCAGSEDKYNPYYALVAKTICVDKRVRMAFQFSLWDFFQRMGENTEDEDSDDGIDRDKVQLKEVVNIARLFGTLIADESLSLSILKVLTLAFLKEQAKMFVEVLLVVVILRSQGASEETRDENRIADIFATCKQTPQMIGGLRHFLRKVVRQTDLTSSAAEASLVKWGCNVASDTLRVVSSSHGESM